jgi:hypothetical protein
MAKCLNYIDDRIWREASAPDITVTRAGFDTAVLHFHKPIRRRDEAVLSFPIGGRGRDEFRDMWITANSITESPSKMFSAKITYTGIYGEGGLNYGAGQWVTGGGSTPRGLFKPVQTSMRCYSDQIAERNQAGENYILSVPRLTVVEEYVTSDAPDNTQIGKSGRPLEPPTEVTLPALPDPLAFDTISVSPNGWILKTRSWNQVLDNPMYAIVDEWEFQMPEEYVNITVE